MIKSTTASHSNLYLVAYKQRIQNYIFPPKKYTSLCGLFWLVDSNHACHNNIISDPTHMHTTTTKHETDSQIAVGITSMQARRCILHHLRFSALTDTFPWCYYSIFNIQSSDISKFYLSVCGPNRCLPFTLTPHSHARYWSSQAVYITWILSVVWVSHLNYSIHFQIKAGNVNEINAKSVFS